MKTNAPILPHPPAMSAIVCGFIALACLLSVEPARAGTSITYDKVGRPTSLTYDDGSRVDYVYDKLGNVLSVRTRAVSPPVARVTTGITGLVGDAIDDYGIVTDRPADVVGYVVRGLPAGLKANTGKAVNRDGKAPGVIYGTPVKEGKFVVLVSARSATGIGPVAALPVEIENPFLARVDEGRLDGSYSVSLPPPAGSNEFGGLLQVKLSGVGVFTGTILWDGLTHRFRGRIDPITGASGPININRRAPLGPLTVGLTLTMDGENRGKLAVVVDGGGAPVVATGWGHRWSAADGLPGYVTTRNEVYNVALAGDPATAGDNAFPQGVGFIAIKITSAGVGQLKGRLSDGTAVAGARPLLPDGSMPVHILLYRGGGVFSGEVLIDPESDFGVGDNTVGGTILWKRPAGGGLLYAAGFRTELTLMGGIYTAPAQGTRVLDLGDGLFHDPIRLNFARGGLTLPLSEAVALSPTNAVELIFPNDNAIVLRVTAATGLVSGRFLDGTRRANYQALILPATASEPSEAHGWFLLPGTTRTDPTLSGSVFFGRP